MTTPNDGQFGGSLTAAGSAIGGSVASGINMLNEMQAARRAIDANVESARRLLESRYGDSFEPIAIGDNTCLSAKIRWK
jgi:hypothetical protein